MSNLSTGVSYNTLNKSGLSPSKKVIISFVSIIVVGAAATLGYTRYYSDQAKVKRLVASYYTAQANGDTRKLKSMETTRLQSASTNVLGASTEREGGEKRDNGKLSIVGVKLYPDSGAVAGLIDDNSGSDVTASPPVLVHVIKENGSWKVNLFNIGLLSSDGAK